MNLKISRGLAIAAAFTVACTQQTGPLTNPQKAPAVEAPTTGPAATSWKCGTPGPPTAVLAGDSVFWTDNGSGRVLRAPRGGGSVTVAASDQKGVCAISADTSNVYWTNNTDGTVMKLPVAGGQPTVLARDQREPTEIGIGPGYVAWMTADGPRLADPGSGTAMTLASDGSDAGGGTNPGTVKCHQCPIYCKRYVPQIPNGYWETYICGWKSCPPCGA